MKEKLQMVIIGAGPAGVSMAAEAIRAGIPSTAIVILEKAGAHSWSIRKLYREEKKVAANFKGRKAVCHGVMCISDMSKKETISYLDQAILENKINVHYCEEVHKIHHERGKEFCIETDKDKYSSQTCVIAIGIFGKPAKPDYLLPSGLRKKIHFDLTSRKISGPKVLVVGGGDSASEYVQFLYENKLDVTLCYRRDNFPRMNEINRKSIYTLADEKNILVRLNCNITSVEDRDGRPFIHFQEEELSGEVFDDVVYALGGTTPDNFLKVIGIDFDGDAAILKEGYETSIDGLFLVGDLSAGKEGGSIISAFNSAHFAMKKICESHLECKI
jgi:thioredoxin reductase (NADPH)